ncbi:uncharacterized protein LOC119079408 [Bradysia coprophila]|uniref:uncharacterized protein LOC119079408 n=1 Tax=Bradysia coprophila TaxID=38358 RepID=UPI00187D95F1|nr:uncharacterized protein LOC119079408 [Bradysia coprophila]
MDVHQEFVPSSDLSSSLAIDNQTNGNGTTLTLPTEQRRTNATGPCLNNLNEDCLLEIFSNKSLTPIDLCSLAETCTRFKQITQRVFPKEFGIEYWDDCVGLGYEFKSKKYYRRDYTLQDVERILKNFGPYLSTLKIGRDLAVVNLVAQYCADNVTLKHLKISELKSIQGVRVQLNSIFRQLLKLSIYDCDLVIASSNMDCDSLIELNIFNSCGCTAILRHTFPNLRRFIWHCSNIYSRRANDESFYFINFIERHRHIKAINLEGVPAYHSELLQIISSSCKELEELVLRDLSENEFSKIVKVVERREQDHVLTVKCNYKFNYLDDCDENRKVKLIKLN